MVEGAQLAFAGGDQSEREHWRSIVLFGRNVASYKFALAKALLELSVHDQELIGLDELAVPFSREICEHLRRVDRQGTFQHSKFLDACRFFNAGRIDAEELRTVTTLLGFVNVIDAFHVVGPGEVPTRFFVDERNSSGGIRLTDEILKLSAMPDASDLAHEAEARWRLVEAAWDARADGGQVIVLYDAPRELLVPALKGKRRSIAEVRPALNGYQKGHCFYCFAPIHITGQTDSPADVDHFVPHTLMARGLGVDLDVAWNLVLTCTRCNRGQGGKFASLPHPRYLERLHTRNEYLIGSNHPLKETIILMTGERITTRGRFLRDVLDRARLIAGTKTGWLAPDEAAPLF